jgi:hypothetical protein
LWSRLLPSFFSASDTSFPLKQNSACFYVTIILCFVTAKFYGKEEEEERNPYVRLLYVVFGYFF